VSYIHTQTSSQECAIALIQVDPLASNRSWNSSHVSTAASNVAEAWWADQTTIVRLAGWEKTDALCNMHVSRELVDKLDSTKTGFETLELVVEPENANLDERLESE